VGELSGGIITDSKEHISTIAVERCMPEPVPAGTLLFSFKLSIGKMAVAGCPLYTNEAIAALPVRNPNVVSSRFLKYALSAVSHEAGANEAVLGRVLNKAKVAAIQIPLPPLPEQHRIVNLLDEADELRRRREQADRRTADLIPALFYEVFGDPAANPNGWPSSRFGDVCDCRLGKMLDIKQQTGVYPKPYLRNANVQWGRFDLTEVFEMDFDSDDQQTFRLRRGDLLICEGGEVGRAAIWNDELNECYFQKALHRARPDGRFAVSDYLLYLLWSMATGGCLVDFTSEATIKHLTGIKLKSMPVMLPPLDLQREFAARVAEIRALQARQAESRRRLDDLFQSMLHRAFQGEL
jgi:type I restriction enzyme S subunit